MLSAGFSRVYHIIVCFVIPVVSSGFISCRSSLFCSVDFVRSYHMILLISPGGDVAIPYGSSVPYYCFMRQSHSEVSSYHRDLDSIIL